MIRTTVKNFLVSMAALLVLLVLLSFIWSDRIFAPGTAEVSTKLSVAPSIRNEIDLSVRKNDDIVGIQVVTINFQKNIRLETYMSIDDPILQSIYDKFVATSVIDTPLFDETELNNQRVLRLINGEFVCVPFEQTPAFKYGPAAKQYVKNVCAIGIPPYNLAEFSGILTIYLNKDIKDLNKEELFFFARNLSLSIAYDNDSKIKRRVE